ncbi:MAG: sortase [bacterium]
MNAVDNAVRLARAAKRAYARKWAFGGLTFIAFLLSVTTLAHLDLLPEAAAPQTASAGSAPAVAMDVSGVVSAPTIPQSAELPVKIEVPSIRLSAKIANPSSTDIETLDHALLGGAVRYPTSAKLGEAGNVILFGHSSYLPVVSNQAFKTFDGIQNLEKGDRIIVSSGTRAYAYAVAGVSKQSAASDAGIALTSTGHTLTLATCDSFGEKTDRFVVTAELVESYPLVP